VWENLTNEPHFVMAEINDMARRNPSGRTECVHA